MSPARRPGRSPSTRPPPTTYPAVSLRPAGPDRLVLAEAAAMLLGGGQLGTGALLSGLGQATGALGEGQGPDGGRQRFRRLVAVQAADRTDDVPRRDPVEHPVDRRGGRRQ